MKRSARRLCAGALTAAALMALPACGGDSKDSAAAPSSQSQACKDIAAKYSALKGKKITVGTAPSPANYDAPDPKDPSKLVGIEPDLLNAASHCVGFTYSFKKLDFNGLIPALQAGQIDAIAAGMYASDERAQQVSFVQYMKAGEASVVAKGNPKKITSLDKACGATAAEVVGTVENAIFDKQSADCQSAGKPPIKAMTFQANDQALQAVSGGRADIFLTDAGVASYLAAKNPKVAVGFPITSDFVFGLAVAKDDETLLNALQDSLSDLYKSGALEKLVTKWGFSKEQVYEPAIKA